MQITFWAFVQEAARQRPESVLLADGYGRSLTATESQVAHGGER